MPKRLLASWIAIVLASTISAAQSTRESAPVVYTIRVPAPATHLAEIEAVYPAAGKDALELMMATWSPGYYRVEDYAKNVQELAARTHDGRTLEFEKPRKNRWRIATAGAEEVIVTYRILCRGRSVTADWVGEDHAIFNGPATYLGLDGGAKRPHDVHLERPAAWKQSMTALAPAPDRKADHYRAADFDVLLDSPLVAGSFSVHEFEVSGSTHVLADFGELGAWDGAFATMKLERIVTEHGRLMGGFPFQRYVFLNAFRQAGGGLEHANSSLLTTRAPADGMPDTGWFRFVSHEYFHAFNVKRLRPIELGPFDYEVPPRTPSLWISEGLTTYFGDLAVVRSGVGTQDEHLDGLSSQIRQLQNAPGRLVQTLEAASLDVWTSSSSGVGGNARKTVSYYVKGPVVGLLLDARIRRLTGDRKSLDDVMRIAYERHGRERGFKPEEFQGVASEVAGSDLSDFFHTSLGTTEELDYLEMLDWFGLRFRDPVDPPDPKKAWTLERMPDASPAQKSHLARLLSNGK